MTTSLKWRAAGVATILTSLFVAPTASAQTGGKSLFDTYCATCHGPSAKGDGPLGKLLTKRPPDLTLIARRNKGSFVPEDVARIIDGRKPAPGHGGGDMPTWGDAFSKSVDPTPPEARIRLLVAYLESIQVKP